MGQGRVTEGVEPAVRVAVIGAAAASDEEYEMARALGGALARSGAVVICGGRGGVMEAVARGCAEEGGTCVGILPGEDAAGANPWVSIPLATGLGEARNALVVGTAEAVVAVGGGWGTLSEIAHGRKSGRAVATMGAPPAKGLGLPSFDDPARAAEWAVQSARRRRGSL